MAPEVFPRTDTHLLLQLLGHIFPLWYFLAPLLPQTRAAPAPHLGGLSVFFIAGETPDWSQTADPGGAVRLTDM